MNNYSKIVSYALSMTFGSEKAPLLAEICEATPNATMAIEKLLGIYEEPIINAVAHPDCEKYHIDKEFVSYDAWKNRVHFKGKRNWAQDGEAPRYKESVDYCSLDQWNNGRY